MFLKPQHYEYKISVLDIWGVFLNFTSEAIVNRLRVTDQLFKSYVFTRVEWCVHNQLFNAYFDVKFKKTSDTYFNSRLNFYSL
jgi:hypothetical protein